MRWCVCWAWGGLGAHVFIGGGQPGRRDTDTCMRRRPGRGRGLGCAARVTGAQPRAACRVGRRHGFLGRRGHTARRGRRTRPAAAHVGGARHPAGRRIYTYMIYIYSVVVYICLYAGWLPLWPSIMVCTYLICSISWTGRVAGYAVFRVPG